MRIIITEHGKKKRRICLPSWLVMNRLAASFLAASIRDHKGNISGKQLHTLFRAVKAYKSTHPEWKLVEIHSCDGDHVEITL